MGLAVRNALELITAMKKKTSSYVISHQPLHLAMAEKPKTQVHTDNGLPPSVLSGRVSHSSSGDRRVPWLRKSSMV
jgi:hypothetical protein